MQNQRNALRELLLMDRFELIEEFNVKTKMYLLPFPYLFKKFWKRIYIYTYILL